MASYKPRIVVGAEERTVALLTTTAVKTHPGRMRLWTKRLVPTAAFKSLTYVVGRKEGDVAITAASDNGRHNGTSAARAGDHLREVWRAGVTGEVSLFFRESQDAVDCASAVGLSTAEINRLRNTGKKNVTMSLKDVVKNLELIRATLEREGVTTF